MADDGENIKMHKHETQWAVLKFRSFSQNCNTLKLALNFFHKNQQYFIIIIGDSYIIP